MHTERRTSYRIVLRDSLAQAIHLSSGERMCVRVLNSAGGALETGPMARQPSCSSTLCFHLGAHGTFDADVLLLGPAAKADGEGLVAFRFQALSGHALGVLSAFLCSEHAQSSNRLERMFSSRDATLEVDDATLLREAPEGSATLSLLRHYLTDEGSPFFLYDETSEVTVPLEQIRFIEHKGDNALLASLPVAPVRALDEAKTYVFFCVDALAVTWFRSRIRRQGPSDVLIAVPTMLSQGGFRCSRRISPPWGHPVTASIENPHLHGEGISRPVFEFASNGFAIEFDPTRDRLFPGQQLHRVCLDLPSGSVEMRCILRMCRFGAKTEKMVAGFEIGDFCSPQDHDRWLRALIPCLFPKTRVGDDQVVSDAWARLERSGYLDLVEDSERNRLRTPFFDDWTRQASHPGLRARFVLSSQDGTPIGVTAANLIYPKTCLVHSGGIDKAVQGTGQVLDLYSAAFLLAHSMGEYCLSLFDAEKSINAILFERFVQQYSTRDDNVFDRFAVFKWHASHGGTPIAIRPAHAFDIVSANGRLMRMLWEHQQQTLSPLEIDAYGWSPDGQCMQQFSEHCAADGYARRRQIFFALRNGVPLAALVAETGSDGMNVFSLLNACSVFFLQCPDEERSEVVRSLLARGIDYYSGSGKEAFLFLDFSGDKRHVRLHDLGITHVAEGWRWLTSKRVIPAYITYLRDLAALRRPGRRSQKDSQRLITQADGTTVETMVRDRAGAQQACCDSSPVHHVGETQC